MRTKLVFLLCLYAGQLCAQLKPASCVHGGGVQYLLNVYLASMGACNCVRSGVWFNGFPDCSNDPYSLKFEDNFDGDTLDVEKWQLVPHGQGALQGAQRMELSTLDNVKVSGGICSIVAKKETVVRKAVNWKPEGELLEDGHPNLRTYHYTSSILFSQKKFFHGRYEIRCRMPVGNGFWPAFWMFGGNRYNEIDVFDSYAGTKELITSVGHDYEAPGKVTGCNATEKGYDLTEWHTFTCDFETDHITFYIDNTPFRVIYRVVTPSGEPVLCSDEAAPDTYFQLGAYPLEPMHIIFNMAVISENGPGGSLTVDDNTHFPSAFEVDYIRFWERAPADLIVYPNPAAKYFSVHTTSGPIQFIELRDPHGQIVRKFTGPVDGYGLEVSDIDQGLYFLRIGCGAYTANRKIIIVR